MTQRGRAAWNECYDIMNGHHLTVESELLRIEILALIKKAMPNDDDLTIALLLLVVADSNMYNLVNPNG